MTDVPGAFYEALRGLTDNTNTRTQDLTALMETLVHHIKEEKPVSAKLSDVDTFEGTDNTKYRPFVSQLTVFFETQPRRFPNAASRINYTGNRLRGQAQDWFARNLGHAHLVGTPDHVWPTWPAFLEQLRDLFGRRHEDQEVRRQLDRLAQRGRSVVDYLNEFERLQSIAQNSVETQAYMYRRGLDQSIKDMMIFFPYDTYDLAGAKKASLQVWQNAEDAKQEERARASQRAQPKTNQTVVTTTTQSTTWPQRAPAVPAATIDPDAMDISNVNRRGPLSTDERERRMKGGLCLYCGQQGHLLKECKLKMKSDAPRHSPAPGN